MVFCPSHSSLRAFCSFISFFGGGWSDFSSHKVFSLSPFVKDCITFVHDLVVKNHLALLAFAYILSKLHLTGDVGVIKVFYLGYFSHRS